MTRQLIGIAEPPARLEGFPADPLSPADGERYYRAVGVGLNPWWFGSKMQGRFDLAHPAGTCYLATNVETAIRERMGKKLLNSGLVPLDFVEAMAVVELTLHHDYRVARSGSKQAVRFGCSRELATVADYALTQRWAAAFHAARFDGISYASRYTSGSRATALALFGQAGTQDWPSGKSLSGRQAMAQAKMADMVESAPVPSRSLTFVASPAAARKERD